MYQIKATDLLGNCLEIEHYLSKPTESQIEKFFGRVLRRFETLIEVNVEKTKYIDMGVS